jgi:hypothetical protein
MGQSPVPLANVTILDAFGERGRASRRQKAEGRRQKADGRRQMAEGRRQKRRPREARRFFPQS